jgi:hypothetical protein
MACDSLARAGRAADRVAIGVPNRMCMGSPSSLSLAALIVIALDALGRA